MSSKISKVAVIGGLLAGAMSAAVAAPDWNKAPKTTLQVFHPGVAAFEWINGKGEHSGAGGLAKGEACAGCHLEDGKLNLDLKRLAGKEMEPKGAPRTMAYPVAVQAVFEAGKLYVRLSFKAPHDGYDKSDQDNELKATILFPNDKVPMGDQVGCWAACHDNARTMPGGNEKKTKYTTAGAYDLMQWSSSGKVHDGKVANQRALDGGKAGVSAVGSLADDTWTITFSRQLAGGVNLQPGRPIAFGLAIHADHAGGRFHHVSFGHKLGLAGSVGVDVKAIRQ